MYLGIVIMNLIILEFYFKKAELFMFHDKPVFHH